MMLRWIFAAAIMASVAWAGPARAADAVFPPASHIGLVAPATMHPSQSFRGFEDRDERDFAAPVVSLSLGQTCLFRVGGTSRRDPTCSFRLASGDGLVLAGEARLAFHGVDRIIRDTSTLLPDGSRINLTLRRVNPPS